MREGFNTKLKEYVGDLGQLLKTGENDEVLFQVWLLDWLYGPTALGEGPDKMQIWNRRLGAIRGLLVEAKAKEPSPGIQTLTWQFALAFWLVCDGDYLESEPLLRENIAGWNAILVNHDDFMLKDVTTLTACAAVNRYRDAGGSPTEMSATFEKLGEAAADLQDREPGTPLHRLVLKSAVALSDPALLDDAAAHDAFSRELEGLDAKSESTSDDGATSPEAAPAGSNS